ncbi:EamA family transporter [Gammaproteobacteria bacterium 42_54_T18]|nr:EamA family transporter [Gammaproteobacteria bacterium 42_54_T18]
MDDHKRSLLSVHVAILFLGVTGLFSKLVELPAIDIIAYRGILAALTLLIILAITRGAVRIHNLKHLALMIGLGLLLGIHWVSYFYSMQVSGIAVGMIALFTYPVMTVFIEPLFQGDKPKPKDIFCGLVMLTGVAFIVPDFSASNSVTIGIFWGIFSAAFFSLRNVLQKHYLSQYGGLTSMLYQSFVAGIIALPFISLPPSSITANQWLLLLILASVFTALPHSLFASSLRHLKAKSVGLIASLQPLYGAILAFLVLSEQPSFSTLLGGIIILGAATYESYSA